MRCVPCVVMLGMLVLVAVAAGAQEEDPTSFVYGIYYECDMDSQWLADQLVEDALAPAFDAAVEAGAITAWGWLAHHTGGAWRRALYYSAPTIEGLLGALDSVFDAAEKEHPEAGQALNKICGRHEDYIWQWGTGSSPAGRLENRGEAAFSVYMSCEMGREERADEIVEKVFAPIYDKQVKAGKLVSWGWLKHFVGGTWRRLAVMTAADHVTLLQVRNAVIEEMAAKHGETAEEFDEICGSHQDYMWDIVFETP